MRGTVSRRPISEWPPTERPREKLLHDGSRTLSDAELLAIVLRLGTKGSSAVDLARTVLAHFGGFRRNEVLEILLLNGKRKSLGRVRMDDGTVTETSTYAREIMSVALQRRAASIVLVHNHPSGDPAPSQADADLTRRAVFAGKVMDVKVQDHIVVGDKAYYSFAEQGIIARLENEWEELGHKGN